jgi:signal transduction histidine kinase
MEERASLLGGKFILSSVPGYGTVVEVVIPYEQQIEREIDENSLDDS